jgi:murein DD-endopeptidase MepM/ murein hydrolase activator NlpD
MPVFVLTLALPSSVLAARSALALKFGSTIGSSPPLSAGLPGFRGRRSLPFLVWGVLCLSIVGLSERPSGAAFVPARVSLLPPVPGGIVDNWRPPSSPYGPGNRGVDLRAGVGEPVLSVGDGTITFAGQVGGRLFVVIDTGSELRITLGFLQRAVVRTGQTVKARELVAYANGPVHVGARQGTTYIDPRPLFARRVVRLTR